ncbi:hypothetical protein RhiXN_11620 [Rhizoctonia solani]|uniref:Transmembrane protein n=1 Tax=Rhizoctonia solani TaxID=456999 RepID=A0A8H8P4W6_9AGAM|nr:uncharacterized protein RhiXN_11620 [Rhizoctonia solani]QRW24708.1 hypothetical protein RhiXN_11620 [Rhizoctonia solani]
MFVLAARSQLNLHEIELELLHVRASRYLSGRSLFAAVHIELEHSDLSLYLLSQLQNRYSVPIFLTINSWEMSGFTGPDSTTVLVPVDKRYSTNHLVAVADGSPLRVTPKLQAWEYLTFYYYYEYTQSMADLAECSCSSTLALVQMIPQLSYSQLAGICTVSEKPVTLQAVWAAPLGFEILIFAMTLHKCLEHAKTQQLQVPLLRTLYRDGFLYFLVIVVMRILNLALWIVAPVSLIYLGLYFIWALITLLISRLLLNLRNVSNHTQWSAETDVKGLSIMQFAPRSDLDDVPKSKAPVSSTGFTNSTRLTDVMEWEEEEEEEDKEGPDFDPEERRASKRRQEQDVEIASPDEDMEMGPIRRGITRHFIVNEGGSDQGA